MTTRSTHSSRRRDIPLTQSSRRSLNLVMRLSCRSLADSYRKFTPCRAAILAAARSGGQNGRPTHPNSLAPIWYRHLADNSKFTGWKPVPLSFIVCSDVRQAFETKNRRPRIHVAITCWDRQIRVERIDARCADCERDGNRDGGAAPRRSFRQGRSVRTFSSLSIESVFSYCQTRAVHATLRKRCAWRDWPLPQVCRPG